MILTHLTPCRVLYVELARCALVYGYGLGHTALVLRQPKNKDLPDWIPTVFRLMSHQQPDGAQVRTVL